MASLSRGTHKACQMQNRVCVFAWLTEMFLCLTWQFPVVVPRSAQLGRCTAV